MAVDSQSDRPVEARPAATVIVLRRGGRHSDRGLEVCLVRRNLEASFMPGVWVFPGGAVDETDGEGEAGMRVCAARELAEEAAIEIGPTELIPYSRWITPEAVPIRFDTAFYLALAPAHTPPRADGAETVDAGWFAPRVALERHAAGDLPLVFPTIKHLESLIGFANAEQALEAAAGRSVEPVMPEVVGRGNERRIVMPGDWDDIPIPESQAEAGE
ncbi:MAG: NUDIX domain-containing protein [Solirubrobacterales bacterium]